MDEQNRDNIVRTQSVFGDIARIVYLGGDNCRITEKNGFIGIDAVVEIADDGYLPELYLDAVRGLEKEPEGGSRCDRCFDLRLFRTAEYARENDFSLFATTLTVSPHKNAALINTIGFEKAERCGVSYLPSDFKKKGGYQRSVALSKEYDLYRQQFCGCVFSLPSK